jgi:hypothetical protein
MPGLEVVEAPLGRERTEVHHECCPKANAVACSRFGDD